MAIMTTTQMLTGIRDWVLGKLSNITSLIPSQASAQNQLADKAFVNSSIATATATFRGTYNLVSDLSLTTSATHAQTASALASKMTALSITPDANDYAFVQVPAADDTPTVIARVDRYKFNGTAWAYEYSLNNSGFTAEQWAAINSGATLELIGKLSALPTNAQLTELLNGKVSLVDNGAYDVSANNGGITFASLSALLSSQNLSTLIPTAVRQPGMSIKFIQGTSQSSDNKYVQARFLLSGSFTAAQFTNVDNWQGVDNEPTTGSNNLVKSGGVDARISIIDDELMYFLGGEKDINYADESLIYNDGVIEVAGYVLKGGSGSWKHSDYLLITHQSTMTLTNNMYGTNWGLAFYNKDKKSLGGVSYNNQSNYQVSIPENARYFRYSSNSSTAVVRLDVHLVINEEVSTFNTKLAEKEDKNPLKEYLNVIHDYNNFELLIGLDGKPLTLWHVSADYSLVHGFIPVTIGQKYKITFDTYEGQQLFRAGIGVIDGRTMRAIVDGTFVPESDRTKPIDERYGGPWGISLDNAKINEDKTKGELSFTIPANIDGSDGLYFVWSDSFFYSAQRLNPLVEKIEELKFPSTESALSIPYSFDGIYNLAQTKNSIKVYGLGDSTNSDDKTRNAGIDGNECRCIHFSATKVIASRLNASVYVNYSTPGTNTSYAYTKSKDIPNDATIVVIVVGINDLNHGDTIGDIDEILAIENAEDIPETSILGIYVKMVRQLRERLSKKAQIVCVSPYFYSSTDIRSDLVTLREGIRKMCWSIGSRKGMRFIDGCDVGINPSNWRMLCRDTTHPMMEGQTVIASKILEHITPVELADEQYDLNTTENSLPMVPTPYVPLVPE